MFSWNQYRIARDRLRLDLFDKRCKVFEGARRMTFARGARGGVAEHRDARILWNHDGPALLFGDEIAEYLDALDNHMLDYHAANVVSQSQEVPTPKPGVGPMRLNSASLLGCRRSRREAYRPSSRLTCVSTMCAGSAAGWLGPVSLSDFLVVLATLVSAFGGAVVGSNVTEHNDRLTVGRKKPRRLTMPELNRGRRGISPSRAPA
jgi:hypothetical protein